MHQLSVDYSVPIELILPLLVAPSSSFSWPPSSAFSALRASSVPLPHAHCILVATHREAYFEVEVAGIRLEEAHGIALIDDGITLAPILRITLGTILVAVRGVAVPLAIALALALDGIVLLAAVRGICHPLVAHQTIHGVIILLQNIPMGFTALARLVAKIVHALMLNLLYIHRACLLHPRPSVHPPLSCSFR
jgi:hypothetical protein